LKCQRKWTLRWDFVHSDSDSNSDFFCIAHICFKTHNLLDLLWKKLK
jgi:hypothetical protein